MLTEGELRARHDFSLLMLLRAWQAPWSPGTHMSFQPAFRNAVDTIACCTHKLGYPNEIVYFIGSFLNRDWWPDERKQCWSYECQLDKAVESATRNFDAFSEKSNESTGRFEYCPRCHVAMYCSKECREKDFKAGHKRKCCRPPMLSAAADYEEAQLCVEIFKNGDTPLPSFLGSRCNKLAMNAGLAADSSVTGAEASESSEEEAADDDDGSWESIESDDEETIEEEEARSVQTTEIYKYFKKHTYDPARA